VVGGVDDIGSGGDWGGDETSATLVVVDRLDDENSIGNCSSAAVDGVPSWAVEEEAAEFDGCKLEGKRGGYGVWVGMTCRPN
jgi:hypothetical protein